MRKGGKGTVIREKVLPQNSFVGVWRYSLRKEGGSAPALLLH
jgi:hypothetical protein